MLACDWEKGREAGGKEGMQGMRGERKEVRNRKGNVGRSVWEM